MIRKASEPFAGEFETDRKKKYAKKRFWSVAFDVFGEKVAFSSELPGI